MRETILEMGGIIKILRRRRYSPQPAAAPRSLSLVRRDGLLGLLGLPQAALGLAVAHGLVAALAAHSGPGLKNWPPG